MQLQHESEMAVEIAEEAGALLLSSFYGERPGIHAKGERDVVTEADLASEALILKRLSERFPRDGVVGEEGTDSTGESGRCWYIDPLDGTLNYSREVPVWCVSLSLFEGDEPLIAVVHDPVRGETFHAAAWQGAFLNGRAIRTSGEEQIDRAFVHVTVDFNDLSQRQGLEDIQRLAPAVLRTRNIGSAALALAYVAAGRLDAMLHRHANTWDYGAGVLLIKEAGGSVTDMDGRRYVPGEPTLAGAATTALRAALLRAVEGSDEGPIE